MPAKLEIHYQTPEGPRVYKTKTPYDGLKEAILLSKSGFNIIRETDCVYIPPNSILAINYTPVSD